MSPNRGYPDCGRPDAEARTTEHDTRAPAYPRSHPNATNETKEKPLHAE